MLSFILPHYIEQSHHHGMQASCNLGLFVKGAVHEVCSITPDDQQYESCKRQPFCLHQRSNLVLCDAQGCCLL